MGIIPIWGFQLVTAIALALLFRLNKTLVILSANISIPPLIPVVIYVSHWVGKFWMGKHATEISFSNEITLDFVHANAVQYFLGATTLAVLAGVFSAILTYGSLKIFKKKKTFVNKTLDR